MLKVREKPKDQNILSKYFHYMNANELSRIAKLSKKRSEMYSRKNQISIINISIYIIFNTLIESQNT